jgi:hypothetical protein
MVGATGGQLVSVQRAFDKLNGRRIALLVRKHSGMGLDKAAERELQEITKRVDAVVHALFPLPAVPETFEAMEGTQLEMAYACAPPDCAWCGAVHEGGPECCAGAEEDNGEPSEPSAGAAERLDARARGR